MSDKNDADFLEWVAGWLDMIDPILQKVYSAKGMNIGVEAITQEQRERILAWLDGRDVQDRLREIASRL